MILSLFLRKIAYLSWIAGFYISISTFVIYNYLICDFKSPRDSYCLVVTFIDYFYLGIIALLLAMSLIAGWIIKGRSLVVGDQIDPTPANILIFIPIYSETREQLLSTLFSVVSDDYPADKKLLVLVVDGQANEDNSVYLHIKDLLGLEAENTEYSVNDDIRMYTGIYASINFLLLVKAVNRGKKDSFLIVQRLLNCAQQTDNYYNTITDEDLSDPRSLDIFKWLRETSIELYTALVFIDYVLLIDTDTRPETDALTMLANSLNSKPDIAAICGQTLVNNTKTNLLTRAQVFEYWITHYTLKSVEAVYSEVLVLSGCFVLYRANIIGDLRIINQYSQHDGETLTESNVHLFGEDRLLTNLIITTFPDCHTMYDEKSICHTDVPDTFKNLIKQRKRWTNYLIFCNFKMLLELGKLKLGKRIKLSIVIFYQLAINFVLPYTMLLGYAYLGYFLYLLITRGFVISIVEILLTIGFLLTPVWWCLLLGNIKMISYAIVFIFLQPVMSIIIPFYSFIKSDDLSW
jgi:cellulose synthase/poly-beta-1,6-N-acetylglucosamine synthase-like glycosyltransferase